VASVWSESAREIARQVQRRNELNAVHALVDRHLGIGVDGEQRAGVDSHSERKIEPRAAGVVAQRIGLADIVLAAHAQIELGEQIDTLPHGIRAPHAHLELVANPVIIGPTAIEPALDGRKQGSRGRRRGR